MKRREFLSRGFKNVAATRDGIQTLGLIKAGRGEIALCGTGSRVKVFDKTGLRRQRTSQGASDTE